MFFVSFWKIVSASAHRGHESSCCNFHVVFSTGETICSLSDEQFLILYAKWMSDFCMCANVIWHLILTHNSSAVPQFLAYFELIPYKSLLNFRHTGAFFFSSCFSFFFDRNYEIKYRCHTEHSLYLSNTLTEKPFPPSFLSHYLLLSPLFLFYALAIRDAVSTAWCDYRSLHQKSPETCQPPFSQWAGPLWKLLYKPLFNWLSTTLIITNTGPGFEIVWLR